MGKLKTIKSSADLNRVIDFTGDYKEDLKQANAKGYTFSDTLHMMMKISYGR